MRQNFSDRGTDEVDAFETIAEKTALAERFGLRIPYLTMNKKEYLSLVDHLVGLEGLEMDREVLHAKAMEWEIRHAGRTPRVAGSLLHPCVHPEGDLLSPVSICGMIWNKNVSACTSILPWEVGL